MTVAATGNRSGVRISTEPTVAAEKPQAQSATTDRPQLEREPASPRTQAARRRAAASTDATLSRRFASSLDVAEAPRMKSVADGARDVGGRTLASKEAKAAQATWDKINDTVKAGGGQVMLNENEKYVYGHDGQGNPARAHFYRQPDTGDWVMTKSETCMRAGSSCVLATTQHEPYTGRPLEIDVDVLRPPRNGMQQGYRVDDLSPTRLNDVWPRIVENETPRPATSGAYPRGQMT